MKKCEKVLDFWDQNYWHPEKANSLRLFRHINNFLSNGFSCTSNIGCKFILKSSSEERFFYGIQKTLQQSNILIVKIMEHINFL